MPSPTDPNPADPHARSTVGTAAVSATTPEGMSKQFVPTEHEDRIRARWDAARAFHADPARVNSGAAQPFSIFIPPPNVTGALHLGHALNNTIQDILARMHRMRGDETLWMPGTDHAGIATQAVVEKRLRASGELKGSLRDPKSGWTREKFIAKVQEWKDEYEARITGQLKAMGCSCDFERQRFTMDPVCAAAVREAFFRLFRDGLIYRGKRLVNWDPALQTAVSDDECYDEEIDGHFYYIKYKLYQPVTLSTGEVLHEITVATTRPETLFGDTAIAMSPKDPRAEAFKGMWAIVPLVHRMVKIVTDDYVVLPKDITIELARQRGETVVTLDPKAEFATGFLKVTPAHDANDYAIWQRHGRFLVTQDGLLNVMAPDGTLTQEHGWTDIGDAGEFIGMKMAAARKAVISKLDSLGLLSKVVPHRHAVKHSDRSKAVIEPYLSDQWFMSVKDERLSSAANAALSAGDVRFYPGRYGDTFSQWHDGIRDWCISRQLWWGHQIPVWSKRESVHRIGYYHLEMPWAKRLGTAGWAYKYDRDSQMVHISTASTDPDVIRELEQTGFARETDVLDTWFSSALWPLSTLGWPDPATAEKLIPGSDFKGLLRAFNPSSVLSTAREIITLWVSRMVMMNRYLLPKNWPFAGLDKRVLFESGIGAGPVPFHNVFIHAVVQDGHGKRMSKSAGNGVDPLDIIASHGSDAMRFTLCQMTTQTQDVRLPVQKDSVTGRNTSPKFDLGRSFASKLWNATRFASGMLPVAGAEAAAIPSAAADGSAAALVDRWMLSRLARGARQCVQSIDAFEFSAYAEACYDLLWRDFCDFYLEAIKPTIAASPAQQGVLRVALETIVRVMHPMMPFVTEAVHERLGAYALPALGGVTLRRQARLDATTDERGQGGQGAPPLLCLSGWPEVSESLIDEKIEAEVARLRELARLINQARSNANVPPRAKLTLAASENARALSRIFPQVLETLAGLEKVELAREPEAAGTSTRDGAPGSLTIRFEGSELTLSGVPMNPPSAGDGAPAEGGGAEARRAALLKQRDDATRKVATLQGRLANAGYIAKAPAKLVEETQSQLQAAQAELSQLDQQLAQ
ncbi:valine--tRNA ligase [soil metagenome]